jgi:hypothetical protein
MKMKIFILLCMSGILLIQGLKAENIIQQKNDYIADWTKIQIAYDHFLINPSTTTANTISGLLPLRKLMMGKIDNLEWKKKVETLDYIFNPKKIMQFKKLIKTGQAEYYQVGFRMLQITDAANSEYLSDILGVSICDHPVQFLQALEANRSVLENYQIEGILLMVPDLYADDVPGQKKELNRRYLAIKKSNFKGEMKTKCLKILKNEIDIRHEGGDGSRYLKNWGQMPIY